VIDLGSEIEKVRPMAYRYLRRFGLIHEDAEDAIQDAALSVLKTSKPFEGRSKFSSYFTQAAINASRMQHRGRTRLQRLGIRVPLDEALRLKSADNPESDAAWAEVTAKLMHAIEELPWKVREAVVCYYFHAETIRRTGEMLHISYAAAKARIHRGRHLLAA
jgi:RNA polymerase sigma-70 factor, ECF subfamily